MTDFEELGSQAPEFTHEEGLDDPYLELFDRINQMELDIKELRTIIEHAIAPPKYELKVNEKQQIKWSNIDNPHQWSQWEWNPRTGEVIYSEDKQARPLAEQVEFKFFE